MISLFDDFDITKNYFKMKVAFIGYGSLGNQILCLLKESNNERFEFIYFDDYLHSENPQSGVYPFNYYMNELFKDYHFIVALGYKHMNLKFEIITKLRNNKRKLLTIIHPTSYLSNFSVIDEGVIIFPFCLIDNSVNISAGTILHNRVTISHNTSIGVCCYLGPSVTICGNVQIDKMCFLGASSCVSNNLIISESCVIGIGTVLTKNIEKKGTNIIGNPGKVLINKELNLI